MSAYKPLAKVEELEENNYNMIDNVLNNDSSKKKREECTGQNFRKRKTGREKSNH